MLLCYSKGVVDVPTFPTSISFYKSRCKIDNQIFELDPKLFESMPTMKEFHHLREMGDSRIKGRRGVSQRPEMPIGHRGFSEDSERIVLEYYWKCMASYIYLTHPYNRDKNLI